MSSITRPVGVGGVGGTAGGATAATGGAAVGWAGGGSGGGATVAAAGCGATATGGGAGSAAGAGGDGATAAGGDGAGGGEGAGVGAGAGVTGGAGARATLSRAGGEVTACITRYPAPTTAIIRTPTMTMGSHCDRERAAAGGDDRTAAAWGMAGAGVCGIVLCERIGTVSPIGPVVSGGGGDGCEGGAEGAAAARGGGGTISVAAGARRCVADGGSVIRGDTTARPSACRNSAIDCGRSSGRTASP